MARSRAAGVAAVVALLAGVAAGCGIPSSGPVHAGAQLDGPPPVRVLAAPPTPDASPVEIVRGFLRAQPGLDEDAAVARSYLTGQAAQDWATRPRVVIYPDESSLKIAAGTAGSFTVTTEQTATIDPSGAYVGAASGTRATLKLTVERVAGQWRINGMDDLQERWLTSFDVDRVYAQVPLYYGVPGSRVLVPDLRWFPATSGLATVVAQAQLEPAPAYLRSAATTGALSGTALAVGSVPTAGNLASIDLTASARQLSSAERMLLWAQLAAAVTQTPGVDSVRVLAGDRVLDIPGQAIASGTTAGALGYAIDASPSASAVAVSDAGGHGVLAQLTGGAAVTAVPAKATLPSFDVPLRSLARSSDGREFAGVDASGHLLLRIVDGKTTTMLTAPGGLTGPSYDPRRWLWTASSGAGVSTRIHVALGGATAKESSDVALSVPWLEGRAVSAVQVSRDGARLLVASSGRTGWRLDVAGIQRDSRGKPIALSPTPLRIGVGLSDVLDATWVDATSVAVLARRAGDTASQPYLVTVGAETTALPEVPGATRIAAGNGSSSVTVVTARGEVLGRGGSSGWISLGHGVDVAFPG